MTDNTIQAEAAAATARKLDAASIVFSLDFVMKLVKKIHKDNPQYGAETIADAVAHVYEEKLKAAEKRLDNIEKIRAQYNALKSAQPVVADTVDMVKKLATLEYKDHAAEYVRKANLAKKPARKANGKADADQPTLM